MKYGHQNKDIQQQRHQNEMTDGWLLLKITFLEFCSVLNGRFCSNRSLVKGINTHAIFGWNKLNFREPFLANLQIMTQE